MKYHKFLSKCVALVMIVNAACTPDRLAPALLEPTDSPPSVTLTVLAAASLTDAFTEIGQVFEAQHPGVRVVFSFGGSQQLAQQLNQGLLADVFASASKKYMEAAVQSGRVAQGASKTFVYNRLVVIFPVDNPGGLKELEDLAKPGLKLDFAAKEVPVGQYTLDFLDKASQDSAFPPGFKDSVLKNVVSYEDNVKAVLAKITLGEADGGIVYLSDITAGATDKVGIIDIPDALNVIATYPIAPVSDSPNAGLAQAFITLVLSPTGQGILEKYRFTPYEKMPAQPAPAPSSSAFTITKRQFRQALVVARPEYLDAFMQLYPSSTKCYNPPVM